jgi:hypothetical protein
MGNRPQAGRRRLGLNKAMNIDRGSFLIGSWMSW